ncbi:MAG: hypothetical protein J5522_03525, partial [Lachnospiraceae bacterium]|nr:hypothetical protein [Lachnospiraceae bacterium]
NGYWITWKVPEKEPKRASFCLVLLKHHGYKNISGMMYKGMRHEILNEPEHERVYKDILEFIES